EAAGARLPLSARRMIAKPRQLLPCLASVDGTEERRVLDAGEDRVRVSQRRLQVPDARELPRVLRAVVPLMCAGNAVVGELIADRFPGLPTVVRALHYLPVPTGGLRRVHPVRIGRRRVQVVDLPAREQRALDVPTVTRSLRCQDERAFPRTHEEPHSAHRSPPCRTRTTILPQ